MEKYYNNISKIKPKDHSFDDKVKEGIALVLSQWNALQMALQNHWGGRDSLHKSHQLAFDIFLWLSQSKGSFCVEDLENLLHESMLLSFNTEIEDGSIEQGGQNMWKTFHLSRFNDMKLCDFDKVAEQLIIMYEECLHKDY